jgi:hypothetical protein
VKQEDSAMRDIPGWVVGALGVSVLVGAFYLGGRAGTVAAAANGPGSPTALSAASATAPLAESVQVACEPGQHAVVAASAANGAPRVACMSEPRPLVAATTPAYVESMPMRPEVLTVSDTTARPEVRPAVITQPVEVYRPRPRVSSSREVARPKRTWERSAVIIGSSAAVGATVGGLAKGKKGALIGGIVGGGAATVWDQVTRRRADDLR